MKNNLIAIHMIGIGGSGMSGLALLLNQMGFEVSGSDAKDGEALGRLRREGLRVSVGHDAKNVRPAVSLLSYSSAVKADNPELREALRRGITVLKRGQLLAELSRMKKTVTVAGSHGKTTTSSMIGWILSRAGMKPTVIVGGEIRNLHTNAFLGAGDCFVMETDESDGSFLHAQPTVAVATNVDNDHLDYWGTFSRLTDAFVEHLSRVPFYGKAILCLDDPGIAARVLPRLSGKPLLTYGFSPKAELRARSIRRHSKGFGFEVSLRRKKLGSVSLRIPGRYNVLSALAACGAALTLGVPFESIGCALSQFRGIRRRLEWLGKERGVTVLDDYGHHPAEIKATLEAVRDFFPAKRLLVCFQPHRYSRTQALIRDFGAAFKGCDFVWVMPIYAASEKPIPGVSEHLVIQTLRKNGVPCGPALSGVHAYRSFVRPGDVFLTVGAGDVWKTGEELVRRLQ